MLPFELTKDTPYLALSGELWSVFYEYFNRNWPCYKGFLLYHWCAYSASIPRCMCVEHRYSGLMLLTTYLWQTPLIMWLTSFNTLRPRRNRRHFADDILKCIFFNENVLISINISLKFIPKGPVNNIPALVQIMAWRRPGDKPLSEPMMIISLTHICVTWPQWVKPQLIQNKSDKPNGTTYNMVCVYHQVDLSHGAYVKTWGGLVARALWTFIAWWRHQMETFSALLAICAGNSPVSGEFPAQRPVTRSFDVLFDLRLSKRVNNREAGDLRRHRAHYDVNVMDTTVHSCNGMVNSHSLGTPWIYTPGVQYRKIPPKST